MQDGWDDVDNFPSYIYLGLRVKPPDCLVVACNLKTFRIRPASYRTHFGLTCELSYSL